jgi:hypothetical protein
MLRALVLLLLVANLLALGSAAGWLPGPQPDDQREPARLQRQLHPEALRVLPPEAASAALRTASASACLQAGPVGDAQWPEVERAMAQASVPPGRTSVTISERPGTWLLYMGPLAGEALARKEAELRRRGLAFDPVAEPPALAPGLSLGRFDSREAAQAGLEQLAAHQVRTARVVELAPASRQRVLRIERVEPPLAKRLQALALPGGLRFGGCPP